jgi:glycosyltransferase involved in cell wall biosynthesis
MKKKLLFVLHTYPQASQTYILEEVNAVYDLNVYEILILSGEPPNGHALEHKPYALIRNVEDMVKKAKEFAPDIMHTHYIHMIPLMETLARTCNAPYTIRTHSYDVLGSPYAPLDLFCGMAKSEWCLRILAFPLCSPLLIKNGAPKEKVVDCYPVINYKRFAVDPDTPHVETNVILNVGAAIPKKKYEDYVDLAKLMSKEEEHDRDDGDDGDNEYDGNNDNDNNNEYSFDLYALGYFVNDIKKYNEENGSHVNFKSSEPTNMGDVYRNSDWLVYTADVEIGTVGWPLAIAEAQAAGIGVLLQNVPQREESLREYLGGGGFLFDNVSEIPEIIKKGYPYSMRRIGIEQAKKSDINTHLHLLCDIWRDIPSYSESQ